MQNVPIDFRLPQILEQLPYLKLLILFGSRARGDHDADSDWDLAVLYDEVQRQEYEQGGWERLRGWSIIQRELNLPDNGLDVVDLNQCSKILAHSVARDGRLIYERESGAFERFQQLALMTSTELQAFRQEKRSEVQAALKKWGL